MNGSPFFILFLKTGSRIRRIHWGEGRYQHNYIKAKKGDDPTQKSIFCCLVKDIKSPIAFNHGAIPKGKRSYSIIQENHAFYDPIPIYFFFWDFIISRI